VGGQSRYRPRSVDALTNTEHRFVADAARGLGGPAWLTEWRMAAFERFAAAELPTDAEEVWRYSRIGELDLGAYEPPTGDGAAATAAGERPVAAGTASLLAALGERAALVRTSGGRPAVTESSEALESAGVTIKSAADLDDPSLLGAVAPAHDALGQLARAFLVDAVVIEVPAGASLATPIVVLHELDGGAAPSFFPRTVVTVGAGASAKVVEVVTSDDDDPPSLVMPVAELTLGEAAKLAFQSVQGLGRRAFSITHHASALERDAELFSLNAAFGGSYARCRTDSRLAGQGASSRLLAAYFGDGRQMHDFRTLQEHAAPRTKSDLLFKGAVSDQASSVYTGLIRIRPGAKGSDAFQTNRNLVLSEGAHAYSVPNLDIEENDVRCSHASAVGPIDSDQRYYLESRGVPAGVAERLIVVGFFEDLFARSEVSGLEQHLAAEISGRLATGGSPADA
jgi:Fe-S cluster assembly protein SufD